MANKGQSLSSPGCLCPPPPPPPPQLWHVLPVGPLWPGCPVGSSQLGVGVFRSGNIMRSNRFADGRCTFRANCSSMSGMRLGHASPPAPTPVPSLSLSAERVQHLPQHCCMYVAACCGPRFVAYFIRIALEIDLVRLQIGRIT